MRFSIILIIIIINQGCENITKIDNNISNDNSTYLCVKCGSSLYFENELFLENDNAAPASIPFDRANCSNIEAGVKIATTKAPNKRAKNGCSFKPIIPPTTKTIPIANKIIGSIIMMLEI